VASGRWHPRGMRVVYTSSSLALAVLESVVNAGRDSLPEDLIRIEIEVPDRLTIERVSAADLPSNWRAYPAPPELASLGESWAREMRTPVLQVPSALVPEEANFLLNPAHPSAADIEVVTARSFVFDPRLR
jgi:RES domain-containing protein